MMILGLDTTTAAGGVALVRDGALVGEVRGDARRTHGARLPGDITDLLDELGLAVTDVDLYGVAAGPGGFTGLRVGMATIQGLALVNHRQVVPIDALEANARAAVAAGAPVSAGDLVAVWMDAHRGEVFSALYRWGGDSLDAVGTADATSCPVQVVDEPAVATPVATLRRWRAELEGRTAVFVGDGAEKFGECLSDASLATRPPAASVAPMVALMAAAAGTRGDGISPHGVRPVYVRRPDAELARARRSVS